MTCVLNIPTSTGRYHFARSVVHFAEPVGVTNPAPGNESLAPQGRVSRGGDVSPDGAFLTLHRAHTPSGEIVSLSPQIASGSPFERSRVPEWGYHERIAFGPCYRAQICLVPRKDYIFSRL